MIRSRTLAIATATALALTACAGGGNGEVRDDGERPLVVAGFYPLAEAATEVGGEAFEVVNLTPPGVEPHDLELTPEQVGQIEEAAAVLYLGKGFQPAVEDGVAATEANGVDLLEGLSLLEGSDDHGHEGEAHEDEPDPHVWLDPSLMAGLVDRIALELADVLPDEAAAIAARADAYRGQVEALDAEFEEGLANCEGDVIVTSHAAFGYLVARYGLQEESVAGISAEVEPQPDRLAELVELVRREGVTTVFTEELASPALAETLAREAGVDTATLNPIEGLTPEQEATGASYLTLMRENLSVLRAVLGCP